jgi:hypothetical protein
LRTRQKIPTGNCFPRFKLNAFSVHNAVTKITALCYRPNIRLTNKAQGHFCFVFRRTRLRRSARIPTTLTHILRYIPSLHTPVPRQYLTYQLSTTCVYIVPNQLLNRMTVYKHNCDTRCNNSRHMQSRRASRPRTQSNQRTPVANRGTNKTIRNPSRYSATLKQRRSTFHKRVFPKTKCSEIMEPLIYGDYAITYIPVYKFSITYGRGAAW